MGRREAQCWVEEATFISVVRWGYSAIILMDKFEVGRVVGTTSEKSPISPSQGSGSKLDTFPEGTGGDFIR